jgi:predicted transposase YdaD
MQELIYSNKTVLLPPNLCQSWIATDTDFIAALRLIKRVESLYMSVHQSKIYRVIRLWEKNPAPLLENTALLPLATLTQTSSPRALLEQVAQRVAMIEEPAQRQSISAYVQVLAGLRFEKSLIQGLFRREIMRESVIYQDILQEGLRQGQQEGLRQVVQLIIDTLEVRFSETPSDITEQLMNLTPEQLRQLHRLAMTCSSLPEFLADLPD